MIHPTSLVSASAKIGSNVEIGPFCIVGDDVELGDGCRLTSHVVLRGPSRFGKNNTFYQFCSIGEDCQDKKYAGERTFLEVGDNNVFREQVTIHRGTVQDQGVTRIGDDNLFMVGTHLAHDCIVGSHCVFANNVTIAGHVHVGDFAILGGMTAVHQFCHIGAHAFTGGGAIVLKDIPPYVMLSGTKHIPQGINSEGLRRRGFSSDAIKAIKSAYKTLYRDGHTVAEALELLHQQSVSRSELKIFTDFIARSSRGIVR